MSDQSRCKESSPAWFLSLSFQEAISLAGMGWPVIRLGSEKGDLKKPAVGSNPRSKATLDPDQIEKWARETPNCNFGLMIPLHVIVLDFDDHKDVEKFFCEIKRQKLDWPNRIPSVKTGRGKHLFFHQNAEYQLMNPSLLTIFGLKFEVKISTPKGGHVVAPGSKHSNGLTYQIEEHLGVSSELPVLPSWLCEAIVQEKRYSHNSYQHDKKSENISGVTTTIPETPTTDPAMYARWQRVIQAFQRKGKLQHKGPLSFDTSCPCSNHGKGQGDQKFSLSVSLDPNTGKVLMNCFAGCKFHAVQEAIGLGIHEFFPSKAGRYSHPAFTKPDGTEDLIARRVWDEIIDGSLYPSFTALWTKPPEVFDLDNCQSALRIKSLAELIGVDPKTVKDRLKKFEDKELISISQAQLKNGASAFTLITLLPSKAWQPPPS